jgi:ribonuclease J
MVNVKIFGGEREIGGNKILLEFKNTRLMLDFGLSFNQEKKYFSEFLKPRMLNGFLDWVEMGLLPSHLDLPIYRKDFLGHLGIDQPKEKFLDGLLLSHAHSDHSALIHFLREDIPIFCSKETYLILKAMEDTSQTPLSDLVTLNLRFHFVHGREGYKRLIGDDAIVERNYQIIEPYRKHQINDIEFQAFPVDHSIPGALAFVIYGDEEKIGYTGDLRFHGRRGDQTKEFVSRAKAEGLDIFLCEGTRIDEEDVQSEEDVEKRASEIVEKTDGLVVVNYPARDLDRMISFFNVAKKTGRKLVVNTRQAYLLKLFEEAGIKGYPRLSDVVVYVEKKGWGILGKNYFYHFQDVGWVKSSDVERRFLEADYEKWEREFLELDNMVTAEDIRDRQEEFIFRCDNFELQELIDIKPKNGIYIRSKTEPFDDDMVIEENRVRNWLRHFNLPIHQIHASGHANGIEIREMIKEIGPKKLIPIHTENPELFFK